MKKIDRKIKLRHTKAIIDTIIGFFTILFSGIYFNKVYSTRNDLLFRFPEAATELTSKEIWISNMQNFIGIILISLGWIFLFKGIKNYKDILDEIDS